MMQALESSKRSLGLFMYKTAVPYALGLLVIMAGTGSALAYVANDEEERVHEKESEKIS